MLKIRSLTKKFRDKAVLMDVNLDIHSGSVFGLIGPNGSGKSTLLKIMAGIMKPDLGCICIDDERVFDNPKVKRDILLISDDPFYFFNATLKDMKEFYRVWYPNLNDEIYEKYRAIFKLDENKTLKNFSKGMKRQSFIVLALAISPKYLFLDEAFDGLDPVMRLTFKRAISKMIEEKEMTVIISSHNLRELEDICDHVGLLHKGGVLLSKDVEDMKLHIHKVQCVIPDEKAEEELLQELDVMQYEKRLSLLTMVVKGEREEIMRKINNRKPLFAEAIPLTLEEIFISETEVAGYDIKNLIL